jgi:hypothetical protein
VAEDSAWHLRVAKWREGSGGVCVGPEATQRDLGGLEGCEYGTRE